MFAPESRLVTQNVHALDRSSTDQLPGVRPGSIAPWLTAGRAVARALGALSEDWSGRLLLGVTVFTLAFVAALAGPVAEQLAPLTDVAFMPMNALLIALAVRAGRRMAYPKLRDGWLFIAAAGASLMVGNLTTAYEVMVLGTRSFPGWADVWFLACQPLMFLAVLRFASASGGQSERAKFWLDLAAVLGGASLLVWTLVLGPIARAQGSDFLTTATALASPLCNLVLVAGLSVLALRLPSRRDQAALGFLAAGLILIVVGDLLHSTLALQAEYDGGGVVAVAWLGALILVSTGAWLHGRSRHVRTGVPENERTLAAGWFLPYAWVVVAFAVVLLHEAPALTLDEPIIPLAVLTAIVLARQALALQDTVALRRERRARAEADSILDATGEAVLLVAPDGGVVRTNAVFRRLFGLTTDRELDLDALVARAFDPAQAAPFGSVPRAQGIGPHRRVLQLWPARRELDLFDAPVLDEAGLPLGRLCTLRDVTLERAAERTTREFITLVSHELRTPLTAIKGYVDLMLEGEVGPLTDDQTEFLGVVRANTNREVALVNQIIAISEIHAGKLVLHPVPVSLAEVLDGVARTLAPLAAGRVQDVVLEVAADLPPVAADRGRLGEILESVLSNACKFSPSGGRVVVAGYAEAECVVVEVRDAGPGMAADQLTRLFSAFGRPAKDDHPGGIGLGLAITRAMVEAHGGSIGATSTLGVGTTVKISLPRAA
jgi:signal transduction histidine kinase